MAAGPAGHDGARPQQADTSGLPTNDDRAGALTQLHRPDLLLGPNHDAGAHQDHIRSRRHLQRDSDGRPHPSQRPCAGLHDGHDPPPVAGSAAAHSVVGDPPPDVRQAGPGATTSPAVAQARPRRRPPAKEASSMRRGSCGATCLPVPTPSHGRRDCSDRIAGRASSAPP